MFKLRPTATLLLLISPLGATAAKAQDVGKDVPAGHWAYQAVQDLASKGLIKGYPPDNNFLGKRTLTRYEMATIIQRVVARMDDLVKNIPPAGGVSQDDFNKLKASVGEIAALVDQFKTQLAVLGTDLDTVKTDLADLKGQVTDLTNKVNGFDDRINGLNKKVDDANILADQALNNVAELKSSVNAALAKKVDIGVGSLRVSGLLQTWFGTGFGDTPSGNVPNNFSASPPGRNLGNGSVGDTFRLRRGEIALVGRITPQVDYRAMFDIAKTGTGSGSVLQDLWVGYQLQKRVRLEVGQQKTGLSEEGTRSSSQLLTIERSIMNGLPVNVGRIGDIRDTGAMLRYQSAAGNVNVAIFNSDGNDQNVTATDRQKFVTASAYLTSLRHFTLGVWGGTEVGDYKPENKADRAGATLIGQSGRHFFEAEFAYAHDFRVEGTPTQLSNYAMGGYALYAYTLNPKWQFVGRYDEWDPSVHGGSPSGAVITAGNHNLREYTFGVNYYLRSHNAKIQLNYIRDDVQQGGVSFFGKQRNVLLSNFQVAF